MKRRSQASRPTASRTRTALRLATCLAWVCAAIGCNSVGQGLVDRQPVAAGARTGALCADPPKCVLSAAVPIAAVEAISIQALDLTQCGGVAAPCAKPPVADGACATWRLGDPSASAQQRSAPACAELHIVSATPDKAASARLSGVTLDHDNVVIEAQSPLELELDEAMLSDVHVSLHGPITLRIKDSSSFDRVQVTGASADTLEARVELEHVQGTGFVVGDKQQTFGGSVSILRSALKKSQLYVRDVYMQSTQWDDSRVNATTIAVTDLKLTIGELDFDSAVISASHLQAMQVDACGSLALIDTYATESHVPGCTQDGTRIYGGLVAGGLFEGTIESDSASWDSTLLGVLEPTDLVMWGGSMTSVGLCSSTHSLRLGAGATLSCTICDATTLAKRGEVCTIPELYARFEENLCAALDKPAVCVAPLPVRTRP
ncbi:MAG TPA: hypothetical protein VF331_11935 [Polyangiales bacterium]